jgi:hypothetical protein
MITGPAQIIKYFFSGISFHPFGGRRGFTSPGMNAGAFHPCTPFSVTQGVVPDNETGSKICIASAMNRMFYS